MHEAGIRAADHHAGADGPSTRPTNSAAPPPKHRFYVPDSLLGHTVQLTPAQAHQLHAVLRLRPGARVCIFDGQDPRDALVELTHLTSREAHGEIVGWLPRPPEPTVRVAAYPSLLQRDKFELVLQKAVEAGAWQVTPVLSARALVREPPDEHRLVRWQAILQEAAEQSGRGHVPALQPATSFTAAVQSATAHGPTLLASGTEDSRPLRAALRLLGDASGGLVSLFVGPEGGYTPAEVTAARAAGAQVVSLGPRTLRAETATPIAAALILYELER